MSERFDDELRQRMSQLERNLADATVAVPRPFAGHPRPRLTTLTWIAAIALLVVGFAGGVAARELVSDPAWITSGLFTRGGALYCSGIQGMVPADAAPVLAGLGYDVIWQVEDRRARTSTQTTVPPTYGHIIEGVQNGRRLVIVLAQHDDQLVPHSCPD